VRPNYARARNNLGLELARAGQYDAAIGQLQRAIELKPGYAIAHYNLGKTLLEAGKPVEARQQLEASLKFAPDESKTYTELGRAFQKIGDAKGAVAQFANATRLTQGDVNNWLAFASALLDIHRYADAVKVLDQASRLHPSSLAIQRLLSVILSSSPEDQVRDPARALALAQQTVVATGGSDPTCLDAFGMAKAASGDYDAALSITEKAIVRAREQRAPAEVIGSMEARVSLYRARQPWRLDGPIAP
jgi:tetratricopeptide (TPR) repeat protein